MKKNLNIVYLNGAEGLGRKTIVSSGGSGSGSGGSEKEDCLAVLTLRKIISSEGNSTSYGVLKINLSTLGIIGNFDMPSEPIIKKIDYDIPYVDNVYALTMEDLSVNGLDAIECTNLGWINAGVDIYDDNLIKIGGSTQIDEGAGMMGGTTKVWKTKNFDYFQWIVFDESTETETVNALFILTDPTNAPT